MRKFDMLPMNLFELRMMRAALRQALKDQSNAMTPEEIDNMLDIILKLTELIDDMEKDY